jgi:hypothetical protein
MKGAGWFVQVHRDDGRMADDPIYFADFEPALSYAKLFRQSTSSEVLRVYTPSSATDREIEELRALGAEPI